MCEVFLEVHREEKNRGVMLKAVSTSTGADGSTLSNCGFYGLDVGTSL